MNEHRATEVAFKNGYKKGAMDVFADIERTLPNDFPFLGTAVAVYLAELKKKYTKESTENENQN